jgi:hypothetical protein
MKRALIAAGAVLIFAAPALADSWTIEKDTTTTSSSSSVVPQSGSTVSTVVIAPTPPPPPRIVAAPPPPGPGVAWMPGHWMWNPATQDYAWAHGRYAEPPRVGVAWRPGHWIERAGGWMWIEGHWD